MKKTFTKTAFSLACLLAGGTVFGKDILLKNYKPVSIYHVPVTDVRKAAYPVINMHSHDFAKTPEDIAQWTRTMDEVGIKRTMILTYSTGKGFDSVVERYGKYPDHFSF